MGVYREDLAVALREGSLHNFELAWGVKGDMIICFGDFHGDFSLSFAPRTHYTE